LIKSIIFVIFILVINITTVNAWFETLPPSMRKDIYDDFDTLRDIKKNPPQSSSEKWQRLRYSCINGNTEACNKLYRRKVCNQCLMYGIDSKPGSKHNCKDVCP
jgi:hypothetical protein